MRIMIIAATACLALAAHAETLRYDAPDGGYVKLHEAACDNPVVIAIGKPQLRSRLHVATENFGGAPSRGCWMEYNGAIVVLWPDGGAAQFDPEDFKPDVDA